MEKTIALAHYRPLSEYKPIYGDYVVWSGFFTTWHGVVSNFDPETGDISIVFAGVPFILFTLTDDEQKKETKIIKLSEIQAARSGKWAINQHDHQQSINIWYI